MSESLAIVLGNPLPLSLTLPDGASGLFPQATVYDSADSSVAGSPFDLSEVGSTGRYTNAAFTPGAGTFTALYIIFTNAGHTIESLVFERTQDSFTVSPGASEILGLSGRNQVFEVLSRQPLTPFKPLTGRVRSYDTLANALLDDGSTGLVKEYDTVSTYNLADTGPNLISHTMTEVGS